MNKRQINTFHCTGWLHLEKTYSKSAGSTTADRPRAFLKTLLSAMGAGSLAILPRFRLIPTDLWEASENSVPDPEELEDVDV